MLKIHIVFYFLICNFCAYAQITSAEIRGQVKNSKSESIPGAIVIAKHIPTETKFFCSSFSDGSFVIPNLKTGGPYEVSATYIGYTQKMRSNIFLGLGEGKTIDFLLEEDVTELNEVEIMAKQNDPFDSNRNGTGTNISKEKIENLPSLNRSIPDIAKLTPQSSGNSFGGSNYRYNSLNIDGVGSNDAFGFQEPASGSGGSTAAGTPGALAKTQPISLDAIEQLQVNISPYDVKVGNFSGASLNVVTRSGTNKLEGSVYTFDRNQLTTGRSVDKKREKMTTYNDLHSGFRIGGPIKTQKLFYFLNYELANRSEAVQFAPGSEGSQFAFDEIENLKDTIARRYGYDAGTIEDAVLNTISHKLFLRLDWNINAKNQFLVRLNFVDGFSDYLERSPNILNFGSQGFRHYSKTLNVVTELKTRISNHISNNLIIGFGNVNDKRDPTGDIIFPHIEITHNTTNLIFLGTYRESAIFQMKQKSYELTDNFVIYKNKSTFTFGTHSEILNFNYHFVTPFSGRWAYRSIDDFYAKRPSRIRGTYNLVDDTYDYNYNNPSASFKVLLPSLYAQHDYKLNKNFRIIYGVRLEGNLFPNDPLLVSSFQNTAQFIGQKSGIKDQLFVCPRVGFNYDIAGERSIKLRGGSGVFIGRMPFAWMAYSYLYNGSQFGNIDVRPTTTLNLITSDFSQFGAVQSGLSEINIVDPNFKLPRVWRSNLAFDFKLPKDFILTVEGLYSKTLYDVLFKTINLKDSTVSLQGSDGRPVYAGSGANSKYNSAYTNVFLLTNTNDGYRYNISVSLSKEFEFGLSVFTAYTYGVSKDIMNGVRVSPQANWEWNQTIDPNSPQLSYSNFDVRHRSISNISFTQKWKKVLNRSVVSLIFNAQSGSPYTYIYSGDINQDGSPNNDLIYVPANKSEITLVDIKDGSGNTLVSADEQWNQLDAYINDDNYLKTKRGNYVERNGGRTPWNNLLDLRISNELKLGKKTKNNLQFIVDIINFTNLINKNWGHQYFVPNTTNAGYSLLTIKSINNTGLATYQFNKPASDPWQIDPIASRWQVQLGVRLNF